MNTKTFEDWWTEFADIETSGLEKEAAEIAWNVATLAERERCALALTEKAAAFRASAEQLEGHWSICEDEEDTMWAKVYAANECLKAIRGEE